MAGDFVESMVLNRGLVTALSGGTFSQSIVIAASVVTLVNDSASPGNLKCYSTDSGGVKGWHALPALGGTVGSAVSGGTANYVLYVDGSGNLANEAFLATSRGGTGVDNSTGGTANTFWARPNGATGAATYRAIVAADIPTLNQSTTGNAATATALQTARTINGVSFDGTANITISASTVTLFDHYADQGSSGTSETDLITDTIAAGQLANDGDKIEAIYAGNTVANGSHTHKFAFALLEP